MNNLEEADEIEFIDRDMEFCTILDIPLRSQIRSSLHAYFAKIHATVSIPYILGLIYFGLIIIQSLFPAFLIDCKEIWPEDNFMTSVVEIIGNLWVGISYDKNYIRVIVSFVISILFNLSFTLLVIRALYYKKKMRLENIEMWISYVVFKFIYPLLTSYLISSFPLVIENFINNQHLAISILSVIFCPITVVFYLMLMYKIIFPRVLFENIPTHEWLPIFPVAYVSNCVCQALFSVAASVIPSKAKIVFPILMCCISIVSSSIVFILSSVLKRSLCVIISTVGMTSAVISLVQAVNLVISKHIKPEVIVIIAALSLVLIYLILRILDLKITLYVMEFFDCCQDSPKTANELMTQKLKHPYIFIAYIRFTLAQGHPFISSMEPFNYALQLWPDDTNFLLFYCRLLAIFPWRNNQMVYVATLLSKKSDSKYYTSFLLQFRHISRTRQTLLTSRIKRQIEEVRLQCETLKRIIRRFWENILQKNINTFWDDVYKVNKRINDIENILQKMCEDYPNNRAVIVEQIKFMTCIKKDYIEAEKIKARLQKLKNEGFNKSDISFSIASKIFPFFCSQAEVYESDDNSGEKAENEDFKGLNLNDDLSDDNDSASISDRNRKICLQQSTDRSPLGRVWITILLLTITTCLSIGIYVFYHYTYVSKFLTREIHAIDFLISLNRAIYEINSMCFYITVFPSTFEGYESSIPSDFMKRVAPTLYPKYVPDFNLTADYISKCSNGAGEYMSIISNNLVKLDDNDERIKIINALLNQIDLENDLSIKATLNQMLLDSKSILAYTDPKSYYESSEYLRLGINYILLFDAFGKLSYYATIYASTISIKSTDTINNLMILAIVVNLLLISLPFVLSLFRLQLQSDSIAVSFSYLPNTEIRSIINDFGSGTTKNDEDANSISRLTQLVQLRSSDTVIKVLIFCFTFLPLFVSCLVTYYFSFEFGAKTSNIAMKIYTLYPAFAEMKSAIGFFIRVAQMDSDPNFLTIRENRHYVLSQSLLLLYLSMASFSEGMWGRITGANAFYNPKDIDEIKIDTFDAVFRDNKTSSIPQSFTYFEQFAIDGLLRSIDVIFGYSISYLTEHYSELNPCNFSDNLVLSLYYWFGSFNYVNRTQIYFDLVEDNVEYDINTYNTNEIAIMSDCISLQILALLAVIFYLIRRNRSIRGSLRFYLYINPQVLLENQNIILLIENEKRNIEKENSSFLNVEYTVEMDPKGIVICDSNLTILKNNPAFFKLVQQQEASNEDENQGEKNNENNENENNNAVMNLNLFLNPVKDQIHSVFQNFVQTLANDNMKGQPLPELIMNVDSNSDACALDLNEIDQNIKAMKMIKKSNSINDSNKVLEGSWSDFIFHLNETISGKFKTRFSMNITGKTTDGNVIHLNGTVIAMNAEGAVEDGTNEHVEKLAIIFEDCTRFYIRKQMIDQEQSLAKDLLLQVLPSTMANSFIESEYEGFSFVVQTATIGCIDVHFDKGSDIQSRVSQEKLQLASDLLKIFDEEIQEFDLLCKVRSFGTTYIFAGGLTSEVNKPERHAEQAAKFALKMMSLVEDLSKKTAYNIKIAVGIHTGGPVVVGVIENQKPILQVIGSVMEIASQMTMTALPMQVQVTRSVYELIFTAGFHIIERGDTAIRGNQTLTTYLINPK